MLVSIIVCTRNRSVSLDATLASFGRLEIPSGLSIEVVVVDNDSTDETKMVIEKYTNSTHFVVHYVFEKRPGLARCRNRGISSAAGTLLLFTDDDCLPDPGWLSKAVGLIDRTMRQVIGGRVELHNAQDLPLTIKTSPIREVYAGSLLPGFIHGCNMIVGRMVIAEIGGFDQRFGAGTSLIAAEDTDFLYRAYRKGIPVIYDPDPLVYHDHGRRRPDEEDRLMRGYMTGIGALCTKFAATGDFFLAKSSYWQMRNALARVRNGNSPAKEFLIHLWIFYGAIRFVLGPFFQRSGVR